MMNLGGLYGMMQCYASAEEGGTRKSRKQKGIDDLHDQIPVFITTHVLNIE